MEQGRRLVVGTVGVAAMFLTAGLFLRAVGGGGGGDRVDVGATPNSIETLTGGAGELLPGVRIDPGAPPEPFDPSVPPGLDAPPPTLPPAGVATIPLPDFSTGSTTPTGPGSTPEAKGPAFTEPGVWVVKADGSSPILVARGATAGVAAGGTWVAFVEGGTVRAVRRSDLRTRHDVATGVSGGAAQGLPISGGKRGVAFLQAGKVVLVDPASPGQPAQSFDAPAADAVAAEEDGDGRLVWADAGGVHVGGPQDAAPADVQRGMLVMGHGVVAHLQDGKVTISDGPQLAWGEIDRLHSGAAGLVAASGGRVHIRSWAGEDRVVLDGATTPVVTDSRILYVSSNRSLASSSLTGTGVTTVATAAAGRAITHLDLLDDTTLVVTVA